MTVPVRLSAVKAKSAEEIGGVGCGRRRLAPLESGRGSNAAVLEVSAAADYDDVSAIVRESGRAAAIR